MPMYDVAHAVADVGILLGERRAWGAWATGAEAWIAVCDYLLGEAGMREVHCWHPGSGYGHARGHAAGLAWWKTAAGGSTASSKAVPSMWSMRLCFVRDWHREEIADPLRQTGGVLSTAHRLYTVSPARRAGVVSPSGSRAQHLAQHLAYVGFTDDTVFPLMFRGIEGLIGALDARLATVS